MMFAVIGLSGVHKGGKSEMPLEAEFVKEVVKFLLQHTSDVRWTWGAEG